MYTPMFWGVADRDLVLDRDELPSANRRLAEAYGLRELCRRPPADIPALKK